MMWLLENPITVLVLGSITALVFGAIWLQTGRKIELYIMLAIITGVVGVLIVGKFWNSERRQVKTTLFQIARLVEQNDVDAVLVHLHASARSLQARVKNQMPNYKFEAVKIKRNLEIEVFPNESPPRAVASFNVVVVGSQRPSGINSRPIPRFAQVTFKKQGGNWQIFDFAHDDPSLGFKKRD